MLSSVLLLTAVAATSVLAAKVLCAARWPRRAPGAAILLWQALGLGWGLAAIGALAGLAATPRHAGVAGGVLSFAASTVARPMVPAGQLLVLTVLRVAALTMAMTLLLSLCWVLAAACAAVLRTRRRHRALLALLARGDPKAPGALVVDHPAAAAYCLPGLRSRIVVSAGTLDLLDQAELAAVLAHERAHARERHDLVLLPFTALCRAFPRTRVVREAHQAVALLVEMLADDRARRARPGRELATALMRFGVAGAQAPPSGTLAVERSEVPGDVVTRVVRLLEPQLRLARPLWITVCCGAALLVVVPAALFVVPL
ncbi:MAG TPA: M56 family metallopeptidase [Streptosporangiaceae bacterium]|nr:M56 family metallopeptidase [Streptosporangiaceae bacterium]